MFLLDISRTSRLMFDNNSWNNKTSNTKESQSQLDLFDALDPVDRSMNLMVKYLNEPIKSSSRTIKYPEKYRITYDCAGFKRESIDTQIKNNTLVIKAIEGNRDFKSTDADYNFKELHRSFKLPRYVDTDKLVSYFLSKSSILVIEMPIHLAQRWHKKSLLPKISHDGRLVKLEIMLPEDVSDENVNIVCKQRDVILMANYKRRDRSEENDLCRIQYIRRTRFPENTCFDTLKSVNENGEILITAKIFPINDIE